MKRSYQYLIVSIITFIAGYLFLKTAYFESQDNPFANEIVLIVLGTIVTIAITSALLNKQSEVELEKEQRVKIFDIKSSLYFELINFIEKILLKSDISEKDLINLEFISHKLSILANEDVLKEYASFVKKFKNVAKDNKVSSSESSELSSQLASLCSKIRYDLILNKGTEDVNIQSTLRTTKKEEN